MVELAFFRAFLAWETFLEDSWLWYVLGDRPLRGRTPARYVHPPNVAAAKKFVRDGRSYAKWERAAEVAARAEQFFRKGWPYADVLRARQSALEDARLIRNAIAHDSEAAWQGFEAVARRHLTALPANLTVGGFLITTKAGTSPPESYLEYFLSIFQTSADQIVRP